MFFFPLKVGIEDVSFAFVATYLEIQIVSFVLKKMLLI